MHAQRASVREEIVDGIQDLTIIKCSQNGCIEEDSQSSAALLEVRAGLRSARCKWPPNFKGMTIRSVLEAIKTLKPIALDVYPSCDHAGTVKLAITSGDFASFANSVNRYRARLCLECTKQGKKSCGRCEFGHFEVKAS